MSEVMTRREAAADEAFTSEHVSNELVLKERLETAIEDFWRVIAAINTGSQCVQIDTNAFSDFIHDEIPSDTYWMERIADARRG